MEKENKVKLIRIIASSVLLAGAVAVEKLCGLPVWANLLVYLIPYFVAGYDVLFEACENIAHGEIFDEDFLMAIATVGALAIGFLPNAEPQFAEAVFVMIFFQLGEFFEDLAEDRARDSITSLMDLRPDIAHLETENGLKDVSPEEVKVGDIFAVKPGERIALDGVVVDGASSLDTVALTGESAPVSVGKGEQALSGCMNISGLLRIRAEKEFENSTAARILDLVENASENKSKSESFISKFAHFYTPIVVISAVILAFLPPVLSGHFSLSFVTWLYRALTFLIISCPCALVVSVPLTFFGGIGKASRNGVLIKGANYMDTLANAKTVVFDKTGTLTHGVFEVSEVLAENTDEKELLHLAACVEKFSTHPIAQSLCNAYSQFGTVSDDEVTEVNEFAGMGVGALVNGETVYAGNTKLMDKLNIEYTPCNKNGTVIYVATDKKYLGSIVISDKIKTDVKRAIRDLKEQGVVKTVMLTGDKEGVSSQVARDTGMDEYYSELLPADKVEKVEQLLSQNTDGALLFAGDGINDAPVLARADVGIAMGAMGSQAAIEAADVVLMDDKVSKIALAISIAKRTISIAKQNIAFAISVKILVLLLAVFGLAPLYLAVFADVGVLVLAVFNAMRALK